MEQDVSPAGEGLGQLPTLAAARVRLRSLESKDVDAIFEIFGDPEVMRYWSRAPLEDRGEAENLLAEIHAHAKARRLFQWGIARIEDDRVVGTCTLHHFDWNHRRVEIGYALGRAFWGQGLMEAALRRLLRHGFGDLEMHRVEADVDPRNERSIRVLERLGFEREGLLRERYRVGQEWQDSVILGLLRRRWYRHGASGGASPPPPPPQP